MKTELRTVKQWEAKLGFEIISYDGFRDVAMMQDITEQEFRERLVHCTQNLNSVGWRLERCEAARDKADKEVLELQEWKREALAVMPDFQAIGRALGLPLGSNVSAHILPAIEKLKQNP